MDWNDIRVFESANRYYILCYRPTVGYKRFNDNAEKHLDFFGWVMWSAPIHPVDSSFQEGRFNELIYKQKPWPR